VQHAWLVDHHPFWGFKENPAGGPPLPLAAPLQEAWDRVWPKGISVILSGHVHLFEVVGVDHGRPAQIVVGDGGTLLSAPIEASLHGIALRGATVTAGQSEHQFGYTLLVRSGPLRSLLDRSDDEWRIMLKNAHGDALITCTIVDRNAKCGGSR
jgi:hypothetical protein